MSYFYKANGASPLNFSFEIEGGVLIVQGIEIATINHIGKMPAPPLELLLMGIMDIIPTDETELLRAVLYAAATLAMSDSEYMPHSHIPLDTRREQFARTLLCNRIKYALHSPIAPPSDSSEETISEFCEEIMGCNNMKTEWEDPLGIKGGTNGVMIPTLSRNLHNTDPVYLLQDPSSWLHLRPV